MFELSGSIKKLFLIDYTDISIDDYVNIYLFSKNFFNRFWPMEKCRLPHISCIVIHWLFWNLINQAIWRMNLLNQLLHIKNCLPKHCKCKESCHMTQSNEKNTKKNKNLINETKLKWNEKNVWSRIGTPWKLDGY